MYNNNMNGYLSYETAALIWDIPCIEAVLGNDINESDITEITVVEYNARHCVNNKRIHSCVLDLPDGAITNRNGKMVASPELLFLELASKLSIHRLILLGLQLCSYTTASNSSAITTKQKLNAFLAKTFGHKGHRKALQAVKYVENGSASIMESLTYMILGLPHALGGFGLNGAVFNRQVEVKGEARMRLGQNRCFVDLYYRKEKLGIEYESFAYHSRPSQQGKDIMRSATLERQGLNVMHLSTIQVYDRSACREFAYNLAARLGRRIQIRTNKFDEMHTLLRELLLSRTPDTEQHDGG